jgi:hypothetical protein
MNRPKAFKITLMFIGLAGLALLLHYAAGMEWAPVFWAIVSTVLIFLLSVVVYFAYIILSLEFGYTTEDQTSRRMRKQSSHGVHPLAALLHLRIARHR